MLRGTIQQYLYFKQSVRNEISNTIKILRYPIHVCWIFAVIELLRKLYFPDIEFFLSFGFWAVVIMLIFYWMPNKKEYEAWKKNHANF